MPTYAPARSFWLLRSAWIRLAVAATAPIGMSAKVFMPGGGANGAGNGDGQIPMYSGNVAPGEDHLGVGGVGQLPSGAQRHVSWPIPLPVAGKMNPRFIDRTAEGGTTTWHIEADQYALDSNQQIVELGALFQGSGSAESFNLMEASGFGDTFVPAGYSLTPFAANINVHTGSSRENRYASVASFLTGTPIADVNALSATPPRILSHPHRPNNNSIGLYVPPGTAPGPHTLWDPTKITLAATDYPLVSHTLPEGDSGLATLVALLQPSTYSLPWLLPPVAPAA